MTWRCHVWRRSSSTIPPTRSQSLTAAYYHNNHKGRLEARNHGVTTAAATPLLAAGAMRWSHRGSGSGNKTAPDSSSSSSTSPWINLALLGPPGSGKGTYGRLLLETLPQCRVSQLITASTVLREEQQQDQETLQNEGQLLPTDVVERAMLDHLQSRPPPPSPQQHRPLGFLLDGFPRTVEQAQRVRDGWPRAFQIHGVLHVDVPLDICRRKIAGRRWCPSCRRAWNVETIAPHDNDGGYDMPALLPQYPDPLCRNPNCQEQDWTQRPDDADPQVVQRRLRIYQHWTQPLLRFYSHKITFQPKRGIQDVPQWTQQVEQFLQLLQKR